MKRKINFAKLLLLAVVFGTVTALCAFAAHAFLHVDNIPVGIVAAAVAGALILPIYHRLQDQGVL